MPVVKETVHHASGTFVKGAELAADHPLVAAAPHLFDDAPAPASVPAEVAAVVKRPVGRPRKSED